jgi:hypothetical protein
MATTSTSRQTVGLLCKSIINKLENNKAIVFGPRLRQVIQDEIANLIGPFILTDQDLRDRTLAMLGSQAETLEGSEITESAQYKTARAIVRKNFGDDELNGFYFQKNLKIIAETISKYLMSSSHIDDVFETDEVLEKIIVETVKRFRPDHSH